MTKEDQNKYTDLHSLYKKTGAFPPKLQNSLHSIVGWEPHTLICAHQDRFICVETFCKSYPISDFTSSPHCRGGVTPVYPTDCDVDVILTCANEVPRYDCSAIDITIGYQIIVENETGCAFVMHDKHEFYCSHFHSVSTDPGFGHYVPASEALKIVDGSCVQVYLKCYIEGDYLFVKGFIIDKLWKKENLLIDAHSYRLNNTVTVEDVFEQAPTACQPTVDPCVDYDLNT
ncbi:hypothetical protein CSV72_02740 [Sporosarcina sp. P20a]|uniref:hypothetical protein n=1 Tax=Sporosarcina sp. P20a TaxID=2048256 RepID=UPI000C172EBE|nr:hypothetical protein [Sporosarcina sp. P20a]PIC88082.1 hypothetical protein CSV72_02740 [Sporosarcina sp. P20a]